MFNSLINIASDSRNNIQVNAINLLIELELREGYSVLNISTATTKQIIIKKPNGTVITNTAGFTTDGEDGLIYYRTISGDLSVSGTYEVQGYIAMPTFTGYSTINTFEVYDNLS